MQEGSHLESLIAEYEELLQQGTESENILPVENLRSTVCALSKSADWSRRGANEIARLANDYGAFMLRNALAVAIVLGMEDGELEF